MLLEGNDLIIAKNMLHFGLREWRHFHSCVAKIINNNNTLLIRYIERLTAIQVQRVFGQGRNQWGFSLRQHLFAHEVSERWRVAYSTLELPLAGLNLLSYTTTQVILLKSKLTNIYGMQNFSSIRRKTLTMWTHQQINIPTNRQTEKHCFIIHNI